MNAQISLAYSNLITWKSCHHQKDNQASIHLSTWSTQKICQLLPFQQGEHGRSRSSRSLVAAQTHLLPQMDVCNTSMASLAASSPSTMTTLAASPMTMSVIPRWWVPVTCLLASLVISTTLTTLCVLNKSMASVAQSTTKLWRWAHSASPTPLTSQKAPMMRESMVPTMVPIATLTTYLSLGAIARMKGTTTHQIDSVGMPWVWRDSSSPSSPTPSHSCSE